MWQRNVCVSVWCPWITRSCRRSNNYCDFKIATRIKDFPGGSAGNESTCNVGDWVWSLGWEDPLEKGTATHSSILARRIPWTATVHGVTKSWTWLSDFHQIVLTILLKSWAPVNHLVTIQRIRSTEKWPIARNIVFHRSIKSFYFRFFPPDALS